MDVEQLKKEILSLVSDILFEYDGRDCGVDPISKSCIYVWWGEESIDAKNIDEVLETPIFNGKALKDICDTISFE